MSKTNVAFRKTIVAIVCVISVLVAVHATGQIPIPTPDFSCKPRIILGWMNGAIPACSDTITLPTDPPTRRDTSGVYAKAAGLYRLRWDGDVLVPAEEIACTVIAEPPAAHVHLVLDHRLQTHELDGTPIQYQVNLYCGYWFGSNDADTTSVRFTTHARYRAVAEARRTGDSLLLRSELFVSPVSIPASGYAITTPITIVATDERENLVFDHWTSSHAGIAFDMYGREQRLSVACWPMSDTVRFTAWYRDNSVSSVSNAGIPKATEADIPSTASVELYDLQGRRATFEYRDNNRPRGIYIAVFTSSDGVRRLCPFLITN